MPYIMKCHDYGLQCGSSLSNVVGIFFGVKMHPYCMLRYAIKKRKKVIGSDICRLENMFSH